MIIEYHRPQSIDAALALLARSDPPTVALGGGTFLNRPSLDRFAAVDLQALGLNKIRKAGKNLEIGATVTLQALQEAPGLPAALARTLGLEANYNLRQVATLAGTLVACDGRSAFATAMLALDAVLTLLPGDETVSLGNFLPMRSGISEERRAPLQGKLITKVVVPLAPSLAFESVARTPADLPIVCVALARWPSGRTRLALGGYGSAPALALDGNEPGGEEAAARNACATAGDEWASAEYRTETAAVLVRRCLAQASGA